MRKRPVCPHVSCTAGTGTPATACYVYDAEGRRAHRTGVITDTCDATGKRDYTFDLAGNWVGEFNSGGSGCKSEIYAGGRHLVTYAGNVFFNHSDWLGTIRRRNSATYPTYNFDSCTSLPFGDGLSCTSGDQSTLHFTGQEHDFESGLDNFGARFSASNFGRFISPDPENAGASADDPPSWNAYAYSNNDPLNEVDPDGRDPQSSNDPCKKDPDHCVLVTADPPPSPLILTYSWRVIWKAASDAAGKANGYLGTAWDFWVNTKPNSGCVNAATASGAIGGAILGAKAGFDIGAGAGTIGGTVLEPGGGTALGFFGGGALGGTAGGIAGGGIGGGGGWVVGQIACRTGNAGTGGGRPTRVTNSKHHPNSASPEPANVQQLYDQSIADSSGTRWAKDSDGVIHRFSAPTNGESHWNGSTAGPNPIREDQIPVGIRRALQ